MPELLDISQLETVSIEELENLNSLCGSGAIQVNLNDVSQLTLLTTLAVGVASQEDISRLDTVTAQRYQLCSSIVLSLFKHSTPLQQ